MELARLILIAAVAFLAGLAGAHWSDIAAAPAQAQGQRLGHVQVESLTLVGNGRVRGTLHVDHANRAVLELRDPTGNTSGISFLVGDDGRLQMLDARDRPLHLSTVAGRGLAPLRLHTPADGTIGKGDSASLNDVNVVRDELSALWRNVNDLNQRVNLLSN